MINYDILINHLRPFFTEEEAYFGEEKFDEDCQLTVQKNSKLINGVKIFAGLLLFKESLLSFLLDFEFHLSKESEYEIVVEKMKELYKIERIGKTNFNIFGEGRGDRRWLQVEYSLQLPCKEVKHEEFDEESAMQYLHTFLVGLSDKVPLFGKGLKSEWDSSKNVKN